MERELSMVSPELPPAATQPAFLRSMHAALLTFCDLCSVGIFCSAARLR